MGVLLASSEENKLVGQDRAKRVGLRSFIFRVRRQGIYAVCVTAEIFRGELSYTKGRTLIGTSQI